jgi:hypothetical protein
MKYKNIIKLRLPEIQLLAVVPTQLKLRKESRRISSFQNLLLLFMIKNSYQVSENKFCHISTKANGYVARNGTIYSTERYYVTQPICSLERDFRALLGWVTTGLCRNIKSSVVGSNHRC